MNDSAEGRRMTMINLHESMGPVQDRTRDPWICSQIRICNQFLYIIVESVTLQGNKVFYFELSGYRFEEIVCKEIVYMSQHKDFSPYRIGEQRRLRRACACTLSCQRHRRLIIQKNGARGRLETKIRHLDNWLMLIHMGLTAIKPVFGISDEVRHKPVCSAT